MTTFATYCDLPFFLQLATAQVETNTLIGGNTTLSAPAAIGATSLTVVSITGFTNGQVVWILDGLNSEQTTVSGTPSGSAVPVVATVAAHGIGASVSSGGSLGSLGQAIVDASKEVENICGQMWDGATDFDTATPSLYAVERSEVYETPYGGAQIDIDGNLVIQPVHFPVRSVASIAIQVGSVASTAITATNTYFPNGGRQIVVPFAVPTTVPPIATYSGWSRNTRLAVTVTYTGGPIVGTTMNTIPPDIKRACTWLTMDVLAKRRNPLGAAMVRQGDVNISFELRGGDLRGNSILWKNAQQALTRYIRRT